MTIESKDHICRCGHDEDVHYHEEYEGESPEGIKGDYLFAGCDGEEPCACGGFDEVDS